MVKEFAIEPSVMATWPHFQSLFHEFGVGKGRLITEYPASWRKEVYGLAPTLSGPVKANSICSKISAQRYRLITSRGRAFDPQADWLPNAQSQMAARPFDAIIAEDNPGQRMSVLVAGEFDRDKQPWHTPTQAKVPRTAAALLDCARLLLSVANEVQLIDPNFDATEFRFREPLAAIFGGRECAAWKRCELHVMRPDDFRRHVQEANYRRYLADAVPKGMTLAVHFWQRKAGGERLHPRFLLTDLGGIQFDFGLDEGDCPGEQTHVVLMEHERWRQVRLDYSVPSPTFEISPEAIIEIQGKG